MTAPAETFAARSGATHWQRWGPRLATGVILNGVAWVSAWGRVGPLTHYSFFPLWLGFILVVDAATEARSGTSLWRRGVGPFVLLFVVSAPFWWYFERLNRYVGNWHYLTDHQYSNGAYIFWASLAFSTVIPAVFAVTELLRTFSFHERDRQPAASALTLPRLPWPAACGIVAFGFVTLALSVLFPSWFFPFLWLSLVFLLDPINSAAGEASIIGDVLAGRWSEIVRLMLAGVICGFFWEMWNYWSLPKWFYTVPHVGFGKIFEMPILGYGGYLPFALEIFAVYHVARLLTRRWHLFPAHYLRT